MDKRPYIMNLLISGYLKKVQCCGAGAGAGAARSRPFWLEPEPKKLRSFGSGSVIEEDEVKSKL